MTVHQLETDCRQSLQDLRGALIELYASVGADPASPQQAARRFEINKNLTWKVSRIVAAEDALVAIQHIPGPAGIDILLNSFVGAGAPDQAVLAVRSALRAFDEVVVRHAGDRAELDLILDSMGLSGELGLAASREAAFRGNSGIWGVQARVRTTLGVVTPSRTDPNIVDVSLAGGLVGIRRLRPNVRWRLFRFQAYTADGSPLARPGVEPIDRGETADSHLFREFCSPNMPAIESARNAGFRDYFLPSGPVGNTGAFDCFFGEIYRGHPRYASPTDAHGEFSSSVSLPTETLVFDLLVHREIRVPAPEVLVYARPDGGPDSPRDRDLQTSLPIQERCVELAGRPPAMAIPTVARYGELAHVVATRLGATLADFRGHRLTLKHPPMNSTVVLRWPLETK